MVKCMRHCDVNITYCRMNIVLDMADRKIDRQTERVADK